MPSKKELQEIQENRREWLEEIAEMSGDFYIYVQSKVRDNNVNPKDITYPEIREIYAKFRSLAQELDLFYELLLEEKTLSELNDGKISIEDACKTLNKKKNSVKKLLKAFRSEDTITTLEICL